MYVQREALRKAREELERERAAFIEEKQLFQLQRDRQQLEFEKAAFLQEKRLFESQKEDNKTQQDVIKNSEVSWSVNLRQIKTYNW